MNPTFLIAIVSVCALIIAVSVYYGLKKSISSEPYSKARIFENYSSQKNDADKEKDKTVEEYSCTFCK